MNNNRLSPEKERMARQREARLAVALRANLRRRKEGTSAVTQPADAPEVIITPAQSDDDRQTS